MPRIIVKSKYLKSGKHRSFYTKYMATREGAEMISASYGKAEATAKQKEMIQSMLKDLPTVKDLFEYEDYIAKPNRENASELISAVLEHTLNRSPIRKTMWIILRTGPGWKNWENMVCFLTAMISSI